ncbi:MAG: major capsid protein [Desulfosporosinus sp.]|nr:major capsid protein [Desulfosporosinus sp.]
MAGLAQYSQFFDNPLLTETIKEIPVPANFIGSDYLPSEESYEMEWHETVITRQADMANIVDNGAELPLTDRDPMSTVSGKIVDIGQSYIVDKKELGALLDKGNPQRRLIAEKQLLGKTATVKTNIDARIEWMRWQALGEGALTYSKDGIMLGVDFGVPAGNKKVAAIKWGDVSPTILLDLEAWNQAYSDLNGMPADDFVAGIAVIRTIMNDAGVRAGISGVDKLLTLEELNTFLVGRQMAPVRAFDTVVTYRDVNNNGARVSQRLLSDKKGILLKRGKEIGIQVLGPTIENEMNPGLFARSFTQERPKREIVEVVASSFPKINDPKLIMPCTVML